MRWVKEIFPPRPRLRWLLMTMRLSISSLAGMSRTLVAVGTLRLLTMLIAVRAAAPRSRSRCPAGAAGLAAGWGAGLGAGVAACGAGGAAGTGACGLAVPLA